MLGLLQRILNWLWSQWAALGRAWQATFIAATAVALAGFSVASYQAYSYVEHDNDFCTTCHLMQDAYARFQRSAHSEIGCHDCHKAGMVERTGMLVASVVENPQDVERHANVPNERCEACHVSGDPARWRQVAATAGHRVHLESADSALRNIQCVTCHSVNLHEFASVDRTCGQAGCHTDATIKLGAMSQVELHCTTCHNFMAEAPGLAVDSLGRPLTPHARQCLGCHEMRQRMAELDIGRDPHRGVCGDCHNPHTQRTAREISCATSQCHSDWRQVSFHVGIPHPEQCSRCHEPHSWRVEGENCIRCHQGILNEWRRGRVIGAGEARALPMAHGAVADERRPVMQLAALTDDAIAGMFAHGAAADQEPRPAQGAQGTPAPQRRAFTRFSHGEHRRQKCSDCHSSRVRHGALVLTSETGCQQCHHQRAGAADCATCHQPAEIARPATRERPIQLAVTGRTVQRRLRFEHDTHRSVNCTQCHTNALTRAPDAADCSSCHDSHHTATADCVACHAGGSPIEAHSAQDHATCASAACHGARAPALPNTRQACLFCHTAQANHAPGRLCENCHRVTSGGRS